ncbi:HdeD family acid-resistance protein [Gryllotalpicola koreensis]|uniref:HdeD family acid-resistance protein n=1 Tax=Gryllotalpicola koreensis TaxID=993086 RepID=A0ABP7ZSZ8_9MICO
MSIPKSPDEFRDALRLEARGLAKRAINGVRLTFGIAGAVAVIVGVLLLVWPQHTIPVLAFLFGIYLVITGGVRLALGIFGRSLGTGHRVLNVLLGTLLVVGGVIALRDVAIASATLLLIIAIVVGVGWIVEGIMAITESGASRRQGWSVAYGVISILGGVAVLAVPGWSGFWLLMVAAIILIILGLLGLMRAFTFGRDALSAL